MMPVEIGIQGESLQNVGILSQRNTAVFDISGLIISNANQQNETSVKSVESILNQSESALLLLPPN
jgi:hypothetical protein